MEMLVVLAIIALVGAIAVGRLSDVSRAGSRPRAAVAARGALEVARQRAMSTGIPTGPDLAHLRAGSWLSVQHGTLVFYADGSSSGGDIIMNGRPLLSADWLTGAIVNVP